MTTSPPEILKPAAPKPDPTAGTSLSTVGALMRSRTFIGIVFVATVVQVLGNPLIAALEGTAEWEHPLPVVAVVGIAVLACAAQAACLGLTESRPLLAVAGTLAVYLVFMVALGTPTWTSAMQLVVAVALFAHAARARLVHAVLAVIAATAVTAVTLVAWASSTGAPAGVIIGFTINQGLAFAAPAAGATALGLLWAAHARRTEEARERSRRLQHEQELRLAEARDVERARIAQELHDVAAQHIAGLVSLCDASVMLAPKHPERALQLIEEVGAEGRFAAASLYGALGDLRAVDGHVPAPTPDLRAADELIEFWQRHGVTLRYRANGDTSALPAVVSTIAYRGLQEALANAAKHATGASVEVELDAGRDRLTVSITNGVPTSLRTADDRIGLGWGLSGLREKLLLVNGTLSAGDDGAGGWCTRIEIPFFDADGGTHG